MNSRSRNRVYKHIESELIDFKETIKKIDRLKKERIQTSMIQDKLDHLLRITNAIELIYTRLPQDKKRLVELKYWTNSNLTWDGLALSLNISKRQAERWNNEIIISIGERLGWL